MGTEGGSSTVTPTDDSMESDEDERNDETTDNESQAALVQQQMLDCAHEELALKKRLVEHIDRMDHRYAENMEKMSQNMESLMNSISSGFELLRQMMTYQQPTPMYHQCKDLAPFHTILHLVAASILIRMTTVLLMNNIITSISHSYTVIMHAMYILNIMQFVTCVCIVKDQSS